MRKTIALICKDTISDIWMQAFTLLCEPVRSLRAMHNVCLTCEFTTHTLSRCLFVFLSLCVSVSLLTGERRSPVSFTLKGKAAEVLRSFC